MTQSLVAPRLSFWRFDGWAGYQCIVGMVWLSLSTKSRAAQVNVVAKHQYSSSLCLRRHGKEEYWDLTWRQVLSPRTVWLHSGYVDIGIQCDPQTSGRASQEFKCPLYATYVDIKSAFDSVDRIALSMAKKIGPMEWQSVTTDSLPWTIRTTLPFQFPSPSFQNLPERWERTSQGQSKEFQHGETISDVTVDKNQVVIADPFYLGSVIDSSYVYQKDTEWVLRVV